jgi:hypothetical protein
VGGEVEQQRSFKQIQGCQDFISTVQLVQQLIALAASSKPLRVYKDSCCVVTLW